MKEHQTERGSHHKNSVITS